MKNQVSLSFLDGYRMILRLVFCFFILCTLAATKPMNEAHLLPMFQAQAGRPFFLPENVIFLDVETTGAVFAQDRISEIGFVRANAKGVSQWRSLIYPEQKVMPFVAKLTGISDEMLREAPPFYELADFLKAQLEGHLFIAHNASFDYRMMTKEFARLGIDFQSPRLCTLKLSRALFPEHKKHGLETLIERFSVIVHSRHRALDDAKVLYELWQRWMPLMDERMWERSIKYPEAMTDFNSK